MSIHSTSPPPKPQPSPSLSTSLLPRLLTNLRTLQNADLRSLAQSLHDSLLPATRSLNSLLQQQQDLHITTTCTLIQPDTSTEHYREEMERVDDEMAKLDAMILGYVINTLAQSLLGWYDEVGELEHLSKRAGGLAGNEEVRLRSLREDCEVVLELAREVVGEAIRGGDNENGGSGYRVGCLYVDAGSVGIGSRGMAGFERYMSLVRDSDAVITVELGAENGEKEAVLLHPNASEERMKDVVSNAAQSNGQLDDDLIRSSSLDDPLPLSKNALLNLFRPARSPRRLREVGILLVQSKGAYPPNLVLSKPETQSSHTASKHATTTTTTLLTTTNNTNPRLPPAKLAATILRTAGLSASDSRTPPLNVHLLPDLLPRKFTQIPPLLRTYVDHNRASGKLRYDAETEAGLAFVEELRGFRAECRLAPYQDALVRVVGEWWRVGDGEREGERSEGPADAG